MGGFSNNDVQIFFERIGHGKDWFFDAVKAIRDVFPQADFWITREKGNYKIRVGSKKQNAKNGNPAMFFQYRSKSIPVQLYPFKKIKANFPNGPLNHENFPTGEDIKNYIFENCRDSEKIKSIFAGNARDPDDYSSKNTKNSDDYPSKNTNEVSGTRAMPPLNQILYGPPGTGKTYECIIAALQILDPKFFEKNKQESQRAELKKRFDELVREKRVRFTTFHQSFSYEDFVEGLRASTLNSQIQYRVEAGIFKELCRAAVATVQSFNLDNMIDEFIEEIAENPIELKTATGKKFRVSYGDGNTTISCEPLASTSNIKLPANIVHIRAVLSGETPEKLYCPSYVKGIAEYLKERMPKNAHGSALKNTQPYVLIIDEINRGNISRIFGELITLIEPSKRAGADEVLSVTLPYSKEIFTVPDNVYLIGTMNTADRSLAGLDLALRRRFNFIEMPPRPDFLKQTVVAGTKIGDMLKIMNQRITALLDKDHCIGHAYFMALTNDSGVGELKEIFQQKIIPLLQEYFFEDWEHIRWVLNDQSKDKKHAFIIKDESISVASLFPKVHDNLQTNTYWKLNQDAFSESLSYQGIISVQKNTEVVPDTSSGTPES